MTVCALSVANFVNKFSISNVVNAVTNKNKRPHIEINVQGYLASFLVDTGADVTVISEKQFRLISKDKRPNKLETQTRLTGVAENAKLEVKGVYPLTLKIGNRARTLPVYVVKSMTQKCILGIDAIHSFGLIYDGYKKEVRFNGPDLFDRESLKLRQKVTLKAFEVKCVEVLIPQTWQNQEIRNHRAIAMIHHESFPYLTGPDGLISLNKEIATIKLKNCSPFEAEFEAKETIGFVENLGDLGIFSVNIEQFKKNCSGKAHCTQPLTQERKNLLLQQLNLNVPESEKSAYLKLILENHDVFSATKFDLGRANHYEHKICVKNQEPVFVKQFRIPEAHRQELINQVQEWVKLGIAERSNTPYNSPIFLVPKKQGQGMRIVQDLRSLNANTYECRYVMRDIFECIADIGRAGSGLFSTIDMTSGFHQLPLAKESQKYTGFSIAGLGSYVMRVASMGLRGSPASYQGAMELALRGLEKFTLVYLDDVICHSPKDNHVMHRSQLAQIFDRFRKVNMKINLAKCNFGANEVNYLGFRLTPQGILPGKDKLRAVKNFTPPENVKQIKAFLGLCNFFRSHIRNFAMISAPLNHLTRKDSEWKKGTLPPDAMKAFIQLKSALVSEPVIDFPRINRKYSLYVDAACGTAEKNYDDGGLGAILCQTDEAGKPRVIGYASRSLQKHEKNYPSFLLEMQACIFGIDHFDVHLRAQKFDLYSDHRPLERLNSIHKKTLNRLQLAMNEYDFEIKYKKGSDMPADVLSRAPLSNICNVEILNEDLAHKQQADSFFGPFIKFLTTGEKPKDGRVLRKFEELAKECFFENDILWRRLNRFGYPRTVLCLPSCFADEVVQNAHGQLMTGHNGMSKTKERILQSFYWPNMDTWIAAHITSCQTCQTRRVDDRPKTQIVTPLPLCTEPNQRIHVDLFGPAKTSAEGKKYILVMTDAFSHYCRLVALPNKEAVTVSEAILNKWIYTFGVPLEILSDGGSEFIGAATTELFKKLGATHQKTSPYHPRTNGCAETCNKTIAKYLASFTSQNTLDWELYVAPLEFSYNTSFHETIKTSPFEVTFGLPPRVPGLPAPEIQKMYGEDINTERLQRLQVARSVALQHAHDKADQVVAQSYIKGAPHQFHVGQLVWMERMNFLGVNAKFAKKWVGPYAIHKINPQGAAELIVNGKRIKVNVAHLKPYFPSLEEQQQQLQQQQQQHKQSQAQLLLSQQQQHENIVKNWKPSPEVKDVYHPSQDVYAPNFFERARAEETRQVERAPVAVAPENVDAAATPKKRGRPRKIKNSVPSTTTTTTVADAPTTTTTTTAPANEFTRVTRAMTRAAHAAAARNELPPMQAIEVIKKVNLATQKTWRDIWRRYHQDKPSWLAWCKEAGRWPPFKVDQVGLPQQLPRRGQPEWIQKRRKFLENLSPEKRNLLLTGDPAFAFDPASYHLMLHHPHLAPPIVHEHLYYLGPHPAEPDSESDTDPEAESGDTPEETSGTEDTSGTSSSEEQPIEDPPAQVPTPSRWIKVPGFRLQPPPMRGQPPAPGLPPILRQALTPPRAPEPRQSRRLQGKEPENQGFLSNWFNWNKKT